MDQGELNTQPLHAQEHGLDTHAGDWKAATRLLNERFWTQLLSVGVPGLQLLGGAAGLALRRERPNSEIVTRGAEMVSGVQERSDALTDEQRYRGEERQTTPRHAETGQGMTVAEAPEYLSTRQLAQRLGVSYSHVRRLMTKDDFPKPYRILGVVRHEWQAVEAYLTRHRIGNSPDEEVARDGKRRGRRPRTDE